MENEHAKTLQAIKENETFKQILKDSFGGIMYTEGTQKKYNSTEILNLWESLPNTYKEYAGGIVSGVFRFLKN